jgi:hypothetical protein
MSYIARLGLLRSAAGTGSSRRAGLRREIVPARNSFIAAPARPAKMDGQSKAKPEWGKRLARTKRSGGELVHERPAWILPALVVLAVLGFSSAFLYYYFGPTPAELLGRDPRASTATRRIEAIIGGTRFLIPENYTRYPTQRSGGTQPELSMHALLPDFEPYTPGRESEFSDHAPDAEVIFFELREAHSILPAERRMKEIYSRYLASPAPEKDKTGLDRFAFKADSGYGEQELFTGEDADGRLMLLICQRSTALVESPNCMRTLLLTQNLALSYRYKRAHLAQWRHIDEKMIGLIKSFEAPGLPSDFEGTIDD